MTKIFFSINIDQLSSSDEQPEHCSGNGDGETKIICPGNAAFKCSNECTNNSLNCPNDSMVWKDILSLLTDNMCHENTRSSIQEKVETLTW